MPFTSNHIKTKKLKINKTTYIGFTISQLYSYKSLFKLINTNSFNSKGLTYININDLPKSIINNI